MLKLCEHQTTLLKWKLKRKWKQQWSSPLSRRKWFLPQLSLLDQSKNSINIMFWNSTTMSRYNQSYQRWESWLWKLKMLRSRQREEPSWKTERSKITKNASRCSNNSRKLYSQVWLKSPSKLTSFQCLLSKNQPSIIWLILSLQKSLMKVSNRLWQRAKLLIKMMKTCRRKRLYNTCRK